MPGMNGLHVVLDQWIEDRQRWRCLPFKWVHSEEYIAVRPKNLSSDPVPHWVLVDTKPRDAMLQEPTPENTRVKCLNQKEMEGFPMPEPPEWDAVHSWSPSEKEVAKTPAEKALHECIPTDMGDFKDDGSTPDQLVALVDALAKREGQLAAAARAVNGNVATVSVEDTLRHMLCQQQLLITQIKLGVYAGDMGIVKRGAAELRLHMKHLGPTQKAWAAKGNPPLDFWEDPDSGDEAENSAELAAWAAKKAQQTKRG